MPVDGFLSKSSTLGPAACAASLQVSRGRAREGVRLGCKLKEEPDGSSRTVLLGVSTWTSTGLPRASCRRLRDRRTGPCPFPHRATPREARPSSDQAAQRYSQGSSLCQEQSENITSRTLAPSPVLTGLVPLIPV